MSANGYYIQDWTHEVSYSDEDLESLKALHIAAIAKMDEAVKAGKDEYIIENIAAEMDGIEMAIVDLKFDMEENS